MNSVNPEDYLSDKRFEKRYSETKIILEELKSQNLYDPQLIEKIKDEDILLKIKYKTYKKSIKRLIFAILIILTGIFLVDNPKIRVPLFFLGGFMFISHFFGIISNFITTDQKRYLKS